MRFVNGAPEHWTLDSTPVVGPAPGPTWYWGWEQYCTDLENDGCEHDPENPCSLRVLRPGWYQACHVGLDICGETEVGK